MGDARERLVRTSDHAWGKESAGSACWGVEWSLNLGVQALGSQGLRVESEKAAGLSLEPFDRVDGRIRCSGTLTVPLVLAPNPSHYKPCTPTPRRLLLM